MQRERIDTRWFLVVMASMVGSAVASLLTVLAVYTSVGRPPVHRVWLKASFFALWNLCSSLALRRLSSQMGFSRPPHPSSRAGLLWYNLSVAAAVGWWGLVVAVWNISEWWALLGIVPLVLTLDRLNSRGAQQRVEPD